MTTAIQPFDFSGQQVRVVTDMNGEPWFVARDVCDVLDLPNVSQAVARLADDEKGTITSNEGGPDRLIVSEPGLYRLIFTSRRPEAEAFRRWVTHDVLPAIRRTDSYISPQTDADRALALAHQVIALHQRNAELEPKAAAADALMSAAGDYSLREAAQILSRDHGIDTGQNRLLALLRAIGWVDRNGLPYQSQIQTGRLAVRTRTYDHPHTGEPTISNQLRVTGKGLTWLHNNWSRPTANLTAIAGGAA